MNKKELNYIKENYFQEDVDLDLLFEMIEEAEEAPVTSVLQEQDGRFSATIDIPTWSPNEAWGDPSSQDREQINKVFSVVRGKDMRSKINDINKFLDPVAARRKRSPGLMINMMMIVEALQATLNDFNESAAGFVFEGFMSALTGGKQIAGKVGGTLPIEDFIAFSEQGGDLPVSLKLLTIGGVTKGSYTNLLDYLLVRGQTAIKYLVVYKHTTEQGVGELQFWEFEVNTGNVISFLQGIGGGDDLLFNPKIPGRRLSEAAATLAQDNSKENRIAMAKLIVQTAGYKKGLIPAFLEAGGLNPEEVEAGESPEEQEARAQAAQRKDATKLRGVQRSRDTVAANLAAQAAKEQEAGLQESFHQREKRHLMEEDLLLSEGPHGEAGSQWKATFGQLDSLGDSIGWTAYGIIDLSQPRINELAEIYGEKLKGDATILLTETKNLIDNISQYYREKVRSKASAAAGTALASTEKISNVLEKDPRYS